MAKTEKVKCPLCKGTGKLPWTVAQELPNPSRNIKCTYCKGKKSVPKQNK